MVTLNGDAPGMISDIRSSPVDAAVQPVLELSGVSLTYRVGHTTIEAVRGINLRVFPGEVVALLGPSGCGKSTTLRIAAGLVGVTSGMVWRSEASEGPHGQGTSLMFQTPALLDWRTVEGNVALPLEAAGMDRAAAKQRVSELLTLVGLSDFRDRRPYELSGGMQQRVALARSLVSEPTLLLLDEPFASLDALTRDQLSVELARVCELRKVTVLLVTHSITEAIFLADRILVMDRRPGRIIDEVQVPIAKPRQLQDRVSDVARDLEQRLLSMLVSSIQ